MSCIFALVSLVFAADDVELSFFTSSVRYTKQYIERTLLKLIIPSDIRFELIPTEGCVKLRKKRMKRVGCKRPVKRRLFTSTDFST